MTRNFYRSLQHRVAKAGVPRIPLHGTRDTTAALLVELDVHPRVIMQILRHAKIATTVDVHSHIPTPATRSAMGQISRVLDEHPADHHQQPSGGPRDPLTPVTSERS